MEINLLFYHSQLLNSAGLLEWRYQRWRNYVSTGSKAQTSHFGSFSWSLFAASVSHRGAQHFVMGLLQWFSAGWGEKFTWTLQWRFSRYISSEKIPAHPKVTRQIKVFLGVKWECWTRNDWHYLPKQVVIVRFIQLLQEGISMNVLPERTWPNRTEWTRHQFFGVHFLHIFFYPESFKIFDLNVFCHLKLLLVCAPTQTTSVFL